MTKVRIHELAKELHMENKDLLKLLEKMGLGTKNVQSTLEESDVERVKNHISLSRREGVVEQRVKPTVIRRRVKREEPSAAPTHPVAELQERERAGKKEPAAVPGERPKPLPPPTEKEIAKKLKISAPLPEEIPASVRGVASAPSPISAESKTAEEPKGKEIPLAKGGELAVSEIQPGQKGALTSPAEVEKTALTGEREPVAEKPREAERPHAKPKKKHEPAKIIERPATPPPVIQAILTRGKKEQAPVPSRTPAAASKPPVILQRAGAGFPKTLPEEEERGRRRKKLKKDVQVLEEGKPNRMRIITTKKRIFKEHEYLRDERGFRGAEREAKPGSPKLKLLKPEPTVPKATKAIKRKIRITEAILVGELAKRMGVKAAEVIRKLMDLGLMVSINQAIDTDAASLVATEFGYEVEKMGFEIEDLIEEKEEHAEDLIPRSPVVTIMGHVDHGKTSLLDAIRQTNVTAGEAGGITQHIGAYEVNVDHRKVVFLDTPGHEAFTAMRARGAKVTDIVILVVAADDGVMNQTIEAIDHAKAAKVPLIVAINKIDKSQANPVRVKQGLAEYGLMPEAWGGDTIFAETSAKQKIGIKELLEMILLQAEVLELKANPNRPMTGTVIEAKLDKGRGPVATVLVQDGTLYVGDAFVSGIHFGHVRAMSNDRGEKIESAGPSTPVEVIGLSSVPNAGDSFVVVTDERRAKELATQRLMKQREIELAKSAKVTLEDFYKRMQKGAIKDLNLILKADVQGSIEALSEALNRLSTEAVQVNLLHTGVGAINESDCMLASASDAIVIGFNVKVEPKAQALAEQEKIDIRLYNVIYEALNDVRQAMEGLLEPVYEERLVGRAEVRQLFNISKVGVVAGCFVLEGKILRGSHAHLVRDKQVVHEGNITSLKRLKDDFREVTAGFECGITLADFRDFMSHDVIECYTVEKKTAHL